MSTLLQPLYAALPRRWRKRITGESDDFLVRASLVSGVLEFLISLVLLRGWYLAFFNMLTSRYVHYFFTTKNNFVMAPEFVGGAGFIVFMTSPLTWLIVYFAGEGLFRTVAAVGGSVCGSLPLVTVDYILRNLAGGPGEELPLVRDEVEKGDRKSDLKVFSCRSKPEWKHPYTIRYAGTFYQVIGESKHHGPRPFVYHLRRLPPGEPARGLRDYHPDQVLTPMYQVERLG
jgi:hypothetical protein